MGRKADITEEQFAALPGYRESDRFTPLEKLAMDYAVAMTRTPVEVPDALFDALRVHLNETQLVELTAAIAWENYRARFNHAFEIQSQGYYEGASCPLPESATAM